MPILSNTGGLAATNCYLLLDPATHTGALIDAPRDTTAPLLAAAKDQGYDIPLLLLTHGHWDHLGDHAAYTAAFPHGRVLMHPDAEPMLLNPVSALWELPYTIAPRKADAYLADNQTLEVGGLRLQALLTPGHAPGHIALYCATLNVLFAGDLLFAGSVGRWDLPESNLEDLQASLRRILALPPATQVLSGHGPATTLATERRTNPVLRDFGIVPQY